MSTAAWEQEDPSHHHGKSKKEPRTPPKHNRPPLTNRHVQEEDIQVCIGVKQGGTMYYHHRHHHHRSSRSFRPCFCCCCRCSVVLYGDARSMCCKLDPQKLAWRQTECEEGMDWNRREALQIVSMCWRGDIFLSWFVLLCRLSSGEFGSSLVLRCCCVCLFCLFLLDLTLTSFTLFIS